MTPRARMLAAYKRGQPDAVPVSPELWDATAIAVNGAPFYQLMGPFAERPWWKTHLECFEYFRADAWIVPAPGPTERQRVLRTLESWFVDRDKTAIESRLTYRTGRGTLHGVARTTETYADWLLKHPVEKFPQDMQAYEEYFFDDPAACDLSEIRDCLAGVWEKGLVTPMVGELFTSFLGTVREGGMAETVLDLFDHPDYARGLRDRYVEHLSGENTSTPHALQLVRLGAELGRFYGLPVYSNALTDARGPDPQAACERAVQMQLCVEAGAHLIQGPTSHMDQMRLSSLVQALIDNDIVGYVLAACRRPIVSAETLALEAGHEVATEPRYAALKFASHEHTVRHLRDEVWEPWAFDLDNFAAWDKAGRVSVVERAAAKAREILAAHRPEPLPAVLKQKILETTERGTLPSSCFWP